MANLICSAKSGSDWTLNDLDSYHISLNQMDALPFFGLQVREDMFCYSPRIDSNDFAYHRCCHNPWLIQSCSPMSKLALCNKIATQS